ncbi:MAG: glycoside hydrolase family 3 C-terminal domain-containing protein [Clostridia bacterium]|nr:glycoside hydrolase family 3 C-terminal domain-containing protein [Clostridia bacterium]
MNAKEILSKLTLKEKLMLTSGLDFWHLNGVESQNVPSVMVTDGPHGLRKAAGGQMNVGIVVPTEAFPTASCSACSWDREALKKMGEAMAEECIQEEVAVILGPGTNMKRDPLCGRNFEYFSEDPVLAGEMAASMINAIQSKGIGTSLKHYAANNQETYRMTGSSNLDIRTLREYYLKPFEIAVKKSQPYTIMSAYNKINNVPSSGNKLILKDILRDEWGYNGCVLTDWGGAHVHYEDLNAGLDLEMPGNKQLYLKDTLKAYKAGKITDEEIDRAAYNVLHLIEKTLDASSKKTPYDKEAHHKISKEVALSSMVLLKNEKNILPLKKSDKVLVIGEFAEKPRYQGAGSSFLNPPKVDSLKESLDAAGIKYEYAKGYDLANMKDAELNAKLADEAVAKIDDQTVILYVGLSDEYESEGSDRLVTKFALPDAHLTLAEKVLAKTNKVVVVLSAGSVVDLSFADKAPAILDTYLAGASIGSALCDILYGVVNPSGKLAETWPLSYDDVPCSETYGKEKNQVNYREGLFVGYRYYNTANVKVRFPFGFGLSYTTFEYSNLKVNKNKVTVDVTNTGKVDGAEVVQLYISNKTKATIFPAAELKNFDKVFIKAGETKTVEFELKDSDFEYFNVEKNAYVIAKGDYEIQIGASSRDIKLTETIKKDGDTSSDLAKFKGSWFETFKGKPTDADAKLLGLDVVYEQPTRKGDYTLENTVNDVKGSGFGKIFHKIMLIAVCAATGIKKTEMDTPQNKMTLESALGIPFRGMAAMSNGAMPLWLAGILVGFCNGFSRKSKKEDK